MRTDPCPSWFIFWWLESNERCLRKGNLGWENDPVKLVCRQACSTIFFVLRFSKNVIAWVHVPVISMEHFSKWCDRNYSHPICLGRICALGQLSQHMLSHGTQEVGRSRPMTNLRPLLYVLVGQHRLFAREQCTSRASCALRVSLVRFIAALSGPWACFPPVLGNSQLSWGTFSCRWKIPGQGNGGHFRNYKLCICNCHL